MSQRNLKKLSRSDLLELLLEERRENELLRAELETTRERLDDRAVQVEKAGSIAEASLRLNGVFEAAEAAATQYLENIQRLSGEQESICQRMEAEAEKKAEIICAEADEYSRKLRTEDNEYKKRVQAEADEYKQKVCTEADEYSRGVRSEADQYRIQMLEKIQALLKNQDSLRSQLHSNLEEQKS